MFKIFSYNQTEREPRLLRFHHQFEMEEIVKLISTLNNNIVLFHIINEETEENFYFDRVHSITETEFNTQNNLRKFKYLIK